MTESQEQEIFVRWLEIKGFKFTSIPNSTFSTSWNAKRRNKSEGLRPGFPDLVIIVPFSDGKKRFVAIEMKKARKFSKKTGKEISNGSRVSEFQDNWIDEINRCEEVGAFICYGSDEAISLIERFINK